MAKKWREVLLRSKRYFTPTQSTSVVFCIVYTDPLHMPSFNLYLFHIVYVYKYKKQNGTTYVSL